MQNANKSSPPKCHPHLSSSQFSSPPHSVNSKPHPIPSATSPSALLASPESSPSSLNTPPSAKPKRSYLISIKSRIKPRSRKKSLTLVPSSHSPQSHLFSLASRYSHSWSGQFSDNNGYRSSNLPFLRRFPRPLDLRIRETK